MRSQRGRRSESFWPSIVVKKWFNFRRKVHDFSEDELETESEDGDASDMERDPTRRVDSQEPLPRKLSSETPKDHIWRLRRRKSETLRVQYITNKEIRISIGTWNVAGRLPPDELIIDDWLSTKEPADLYVIGFQEVVALNAGNVLGAEDKSPIPIWETIIRKTLNQIDQQDSCKSKSYSAPPSPDRSPLSPPEELEVDDVEVSVEYMSDPFGLEDPSQEPVISVKKHLLESNNRNVLSWPERPLDIPASKLPLHQRRLRRVCSSSGLVRPSVLEKSVVQLSSMDGSLRRGYRSSGDLTLAWTEKKLDHLPRPSNSSKVIPNEDDLDLNNSSVDPVEVAEGNECRKGRPKYVRVISKQMVGIFVSIWVRKSLRKHINNIKVSPVGVGLMGYMGNKGSVSVSMSLFQTRLCFVCSHLTSGQKDGDQERRNSDVNEIIRRTRFASATDTDEPQTIRSHDQFFWFGDLNYRLNLDAVEARELVLKKQWDELITSDQLYQELRRGKTFDGWKEGAIGFAPTYKYRVESGEYAGQKEGEKKRSPAWCDRVIWSGKGVQQLSYTRSELRLSDHRPVSAMFLVDVEVFNLQKLQKVLHLHKHTDPIFGLIDEEDHDDSQLPWSRTHD